MTLLYVFNREKGITLLEIIVTIAITSIVMGAIVTFMDRVIHFKGTADTIQRLRKLETAFEVLYRENIRFVEDNCYGWIDKECRSLTVLPITNPAGKGTLNITTYSDAALGAFRNSGCTVTPETLPAYRIICIDGYGFDYTFTASNEHAAGTIYVNGYNRKPYSVAITAGGNKSISDTWSSGYLDNEYITRSHDKLLIISRAMRSYHLSRLTMEAISNPCGEQGGLASNDDILIPWVWQAAGTGPTVKCSGAVNGRCGCSGFNTGIWSNDAANNFLNTGADVSRFLANINVGDEYRTDGFGNPVAIGVITRPDGTAFDSAPPIPSPDWTWPAHTPPYGGTVGIMKDGVWIYSKRVIYPQ